VSLHGAPELRGTTSEKASSATWRPCF
jgi:hypothetical protein